MATKAPQPYSTDLQTACQASGCRKWAVVTIYTARNEVVGKFCRECGRRKLKKLKTS